MSESPQAAFTSNPRQLDSGELARFKAAATSSTIRPRNRRLVSTEQQLLSTSATSSPSVSRAVSPIPSKHPSRSATNASNNGRPVGGLLAPPSGSRTGNGKSSPVDFGGIWEGGWMSSWSALQGLASSVLGVEVDGEGDGNTKNKSYIRRTAVRASNLKQLPATWGPAGESNTEGSVGSGGAVERDAALRAKKMAGILEGREGVGGTVDTNGNYKRRTSLEETRNGEQDDGDAMVYIHHVQPQDTLAGVVLRYNCQPAVFRKANRFWPNDSIQSRKVVVLPVDSCAIKGRPCEPPSSDYPFQGIDLLAPTPDVEDPPSSNDGGTWPGAPNETSAERLESDDNPPWTHVRWVHIDSSPSSKPIEIARMPRKTLGYFPPRRRKSQATISTASTPRVSSDFPQLSQPSSQLSCDLSGTVTSTPSRRTSNLGPQPSQPIIGSYFPAASSSTRPRGDSVSESAERLGWMRGPGGVGTFGRSVRKPGPGQDGLNSWARKFMPGLAIDSLPSTSFLGSESAHFGFSDDLASIAEGPLRSSSGGNSTPVGAGQGLGLENTAAAIENWVRRLAKGPGTPKLGGARIESTDLIELLDGAGSDDGRGLEFSPGSIRPTPMGNSGSGRADLDGLIRGRTTAGAKGGKSD